MFLMKLQAKEKFSFLQLAHYLARIDNTFGEKEEEIILEYCSEMGVENLTFFDFDNFSLEETLNDFKSLQSKRIVILELMILIHIDNEFNFMEKELLDRIILHFKLGYEDLEIYSSWGRAVSSLYEQGKSFIKK